jgi:integrase
MFSCRDVSRKVAHRLRQLPGNLLDALQPLNEALRKRGIRMAVQQIKQGLWIRGTLPLGDGSRKQKRISLGLKAVEGSLLEAESRAIALAAAIKAGTYPGSGLPWAQAIVSPDETPTICTRTVAEWTEELERSFWQGKIRSSAAELTWDRIKSELKRLPNGATLTTSLLVAVAARTTAGSRSRLEACKVYKRMGKLAGLSDLEQLDALRTPYEPCERQLPSDEQLLQLLGRIRSHPKYGWLTAALVVYGCRPAEAFSLQPAADGTARVLTVKQKGKLPSWRTALALPPAWVKRFDLMDIATPWPVRTPTAYDSLEAKRWTQPWGSWIKRQETGLQLYSIRHAWAVRSIQFDVNASLAAKTMGHSIAVHNNTYHRWLAQSDVAAVASRLRQSK